VGGYGPERIDSSALGAALSARVRGTLPLTPGDAGIEIPVAVPAVAEPPVAEPMMSPAR